MHPHRKFRPDKSDNDADFKRRGCADMRAEVTDAWRYAGREAGTV